MSRPKDWEPLHDGDPIPGDPYEVAALGKKLRNMADEIDKQSGNIKALASVEGWDSDAGRAFHEIAGNTSARLKRAYDRYDEAALALGTKVSESDHESSEYASELNRAQKVADKALRDFREAEGSHKTAVKGLEPYEGKLPSKDDHADRTKLEKQREEAMGALRECHSEIGRAKIIRDDAAKAAAKKIKNIIHHDGVRDPGGFFNFLADWADAFSNLSALFSVLALACLIIPGAQILVPVFAALAVATSALALAGHAYDMTVRGGKLNVLKLTLDALGVFPGLGALKGLTALKGLKGMARFMPLRFTGKGMAGLADNFMNGFAVKRINGILGMVGRPAIAGEKITAVIKGAGFANALNKVFNHGFGHSTGDPGDSPSPSAPAPKPSPQPSPGPAPKPSTAPFHAAVAG